MITNAVLPDGSIMPINEFDPPSFDKIFHFCKNIDGTFYYIIHSGNDFCEYCVPGNYKLTEYNEDTIWIEYAS